MIKWTLIIVFFFVKSISIAQSIDNAAFKQMMAIENSIKSEADSMINADDMLQRFKSDSIFTRGLVGALKVKNSFYYGFDSLRISKLYAPDSSFKIFTWQVMKDFTYYRQRGAIQMKTSDGSLKLFPLFDASDFTRNAIDSMRDTQHWIGAIYYKILQHKVGSVIYYTLLGSDANNERSNKKYIEILTFNADGKPQFGAPIFALKGSGNIAATNTFRYCMEYKKDAGVRMNYDKNIEVIVMDNLISENNEPQFKHTLIPYGDYEGFRWLKGKWTYTDKPFDKIIDQKPNYLPKPINENPIRNNNNN